MPPKSKPSKTYVETYSSKCRNSNAVQPISKKKAPEFTHAVLKRDYQNCVEIKTIDE